MGRKAAVDNIPRYAELLDKVRKTLIEGQKRLERERVRTCWETGRVIRGHILNYGRAGRGEETVLRLAKDMGVSATVLHRCVKFAGKYPDWRKVAARPLFSWSHYRQLIAVADDKKRLRLETAAARGRWSAEELAGRLKKDNRPARGPEPSVKQQTLSENKPLAPLRGELHTYRLVARPALAPDAGDGLLVDLGFGVYREPGGLLPARSVKDGIVETRPGGEARVLIKSKRTAGDLYTYWAFVEKVIDGDTLKARLDLGFGVWTRQVLRLRGLDCPELGTAAGDEAGRFVRSRLKKAARIVVRSSRSDKYDRYLADIFIPEDPDAPDPAQDVYLNNLLIETGRAVRAG